MYVVYNSLVRCIQTLSNKKQQLMSLRFVGLYSVRHPSVLQAGQEMLVQEAQRDSGTLDTCI